MEALHVPSRNLRAATKGFVARALLSATALLLVFMLSFGFGSAGLSSAYADDQQATPSAQVDEKSSASSDEKSEVAADSKAAEASEEQIEENGNPTSSGLGGSEPLAGVANVGTVAVVGILAVAVIFFVVMRRLNGSIKRMNGMFK